jgi:hypothetical protein
MFGCKELALESRAVIRGKFPSFGMAWELESGNAVKFRGTASLRASRARDFPRVGPRNRVESVPASDSPPRTPSFRDSWRATNPGEASDGPWRGERLQTRTRRSVAAAPRFAPSSSPWTRLPLLALSHGRSGAGLSPTPWPPLSSPGPNPRNPHGASPMSCRRPRHRAAAVTVPARGA